MSNETNCNGHGHRVPCENVIPIDQIEQAFFEHMATRSVKTVTASKFVGLACKRIDKAATLLAHNNLDAEGPIADAIQHLTVALNTLRNKE